MIVNDETYIIDDRTFNIGGELVNDCRFDGLMIHLNNLCRDDKEVINQVIEHALETHNNTLNVINDVCGEDTYIEILEKIIPNENNIESPCIVCYVNSEGGDSICGMNLHTKLRNTTAEKVKTIINGIALSAGAVIFLAGDMRVCYDNSEFMIHYASFTQLNNITFDDLDRLGCKLSKLDNNFLDIVVKKSLKSIDIDGKTVKLNKNFWMKKLKTDFVLEGKAIFDYGFANVYVDNTSHIYIRDEDGEEVTYNKEEHGTLEI